MQNFAYTYDLLGNPLSRSDANTSMSETFGYDPLNRLTSAVVALSPTPLSKSFTYSPIGNILSKSDVGNYNYNAAGSAQPHAVMSTSGGTISTTFTYDPNGNQTSGLGRNITWTSYNKPASITQGTRTINFLDDTEHQRFKQVTPEGTTLYIAGFGVLAEIANPGTSATWTEYLSVGNAKVGMRTLQVATSTLSTRYFLTDHLGSVSVITDENGLVVQRLSYDAWGKRRNPDGTDDTTGSITSQTTRGFTGEEQLSVGGLVHLNGRVYDPLLARMTSADPTVTDPTNPQGWNRYSYVGNDPLAFTDPNGFSWLSSFFHSVSNFLTQNVLSIVQIAITTVLSFTPLGPIAAAAIGAAIVTGIAGGNIGQVLKAAAIAGLTAFAFDVVGDMTNTLPGANPGANGTHGIPTFGTEAYAFNVAGHALVGCGSAVASGGSCEAGALAAGAGAASAPALKNLNFGARLVATSTIGGIASVAGGGKFANGAVAASFGYLFNELGTMQQRAYEPTAYSDGTMCNSGTVQACIVEGAVSVTTGPVEILAAGIFGGVRALIGTLTGSFFDGASYTQKVKDQMMQNDFHSFPSSVEAFEGAGQVQTITGPASRCRQPTLLLLHGGPGADHSVYRPAYSALSDIAQIVYLDHRGNGRSEDGPRERWTLAQWGDDVRAFCDTLGIADPIVLGASFGGMVAMSYATRHPDHPSKLILISTEAVGGSWPERRVELFERFGGAEAGALARRRFIEVCGQPDQAWLDAWRRLAMPHYTRIPRDPDAARRAVSRPEVLRWFSNPGGESQSFDMLAELGRIRCPTLVLGGEDDPIHPIESQADIVAALPPHLVQFERFKDCRHAVIPDMPERAFAAIRDFIMRPK